VARSLGETVCGVRRYDGELGSNMLRFRLMVALQFTFRSTSTSRLFA